MKSLLAAVLVVFGFFVSPVCAQISASGYYFGKIGASDVMISVMRSRTFVVYYFDRASQQVDYASGVFGSDMTANVTGSSGRPVSLSAISAGLGTITGVYSGTPFTTTLESSLGTYASRAFSYSGTAIDATTGAVTIMLLTITAPGKAVLMYVGDTAVTGGVGTIGTDGTVRVTLTNGSTVSSLFSANGGTATGKFTGTGANTVQYILIQTQRAPLINISTRGAVGPGNTLTAGFVINDGPKMILIRAIGPTLTAFGVDGAQADPVLTLYSSGQGIALNDNWGSASNASDIARAAAQVGGFPLVTSSKDAAMLLMLEPGLYSAQVTAKGTAVGDALVEIYEVR